MDAHIFPYRLKFKFPFKIAHTERTHTENLYLLLEDQGRYGWGEAAFPPYMPESRDQAVRFLGAIRWPSGASQNSLESFLSDLQKKYSQHTCALAAIDIAVHNLEAAKSGISIREKYGIPFLAKETSVTLGMSGKEELKKKVELNPNAAYFKLKVNETEIGRMVNDYLDLTAKPFVVDANQGFSSLASALDWCVELSRLNAGYIEQPFHKDDLESHRWLKSKSPIPVIADESFQRIADLSRIAGSFDGINVKLMKSGGISEAQRALKKARQIGLQTVIGCMSESSVAIAAAWELAPLADWADLDGPLLVENDLFNPDLNYDKKRIVETLKKFSNEF